MIHCSHENELNDDSNVMDSKSSIVHESIYKSSKVTDSQGNVVNCMPSHLIPLYEKRKAEIIERIRSTFGLNPNARINPRSGYELDMIMFEGRMHVPCSRNFSQIKFYNQATSRR